MNTNTSLLYLAIAISKQADPLHPNFRRALKPETLQMHEYITQCSAKAYDAFPDEPRKAIVAVGKALKNDVKCYVTFFKAIASNAAFAAHMDCVKYTRAADEASLEDGSDQMLDIEPEEAQRKLDMTDVALFDASGAQRSDRLGNPEREGVDSQPEEAVATSIEDAYVAIKAAQAWVSLAFLKMTPESQAYWGVAGLVPLAQRRDTLPSGEFTYSAVIDFDDYRELQDELYDAKRRRVEFDVDLENEMIDA